MRRLSYRQRTNKIGEAIIEYSNSSKVIDHRIKVEVKNPEDGLDRIERILNDMNIIDGFANELKIYKQTYLKP